MKSVQHLSLSPSQKNSYISCGYPPNLSGSDTDVSTSNENLTMEEKSVLQSGIRQEPQGEETVLPGSDLLSSNTLIIHEKKHSSSPFYTQLYNEKRTSDSPEKYQINYGDVPRGSTPVPSSPKSRRPSYPSLLHQKSPQQGSWEQYVSPGDYSPGNNSQSGDGYYLLGANHNPYQDTTQGLSDISKDYLDQSEVLKYLAKEMNHHNVLSEITNYRQVPDYGSSSLEHPQIILTNPRRRGSYGVGLNVRSKSVDRLSISRSHPDLSHTNYHSEDHTSANISPTYQRYNNRSRVGLGVESDGQASQMIELLSAENTALKTELDLYCKKVNKLQKFELEIQKVHKAYEDLVHSSEKRERLEKSIRSRLEMEIRRLQEHNKGLREHLESASPHLSKSSYSDLSDSELHKELKKREVLISQLFSQTKVLLAEKDRQEIELQAQRATLQEQRNHIDILDNALTNAQANVVRLEEESRKKQVYVDRVPQLQKALTNLQQSSEKRLLVEKKLRAQHEKEIQALRAQKQGTLLRTDSLENIENLKKQVMDYEEKIIGLEAEVSKWEQRYIAESTMRQIAVDAASVPKDAKIAALEKTSQESEKLIAQARTEKLKHMDELYAASRKTTELESRIKDFESKLAEKDAMIRVLQQHSQDKDAVFQNCVLGRPPRHGRASSTVAPSPASTLHRKTGSASGSLLSISVSSGDSSPRLPPSSPVTDSATASQKSLDEQLKELDTRLSRLHHKRSSSRERKVSKSLLESMKEMMCNT